MRKYIVTVASVALVAASVPATPATAQTPRDLRDLIGARGSSAESALGSRGYTYIKSMGVAAFWWNKGSRACVSVAVDNGRVSSIQSTAAGDCGHTAGGNNDSAQTAVIAGALAVGLAAAMASHHKSTGNKRNAEAYNSEYERGYNDALYGAHYANNDSEGYHAGYMAGEAERQNRRASNSSFVRGAPRAAQTACTQRADDYWGVPYGSSVAVSVFNYGQDNYEVTVASGHRRAHCSVTGQGRVSDFNPA